MGSAIKSIGAGVSGVMSMVGGNKNATNINKGIKSNTVQTEKGIKELRSGSDAAAQQYQPYANLSGQSLAQLLSAYYGGPQQYTDANGVQQTTTYSPQESEAFKFIKENTQRDLDRRLRSMGRSNSTYGMNAMGRTLGDLNAQNEQQQYSRLGNMIDLSKYGTGGLASTRYNAGGSLANLYSGLGAKQMQGYQSLGQAKSDMWNNAAKWNYQSASDGGDAMDDWLSMGGGGFGK